MNVKEKGGSTELEVVMAARQKRRKRTKKLVYFLILPAMVFLSFFTFYPFIKAIYLSFFVTDPLGNPGTYVGLKNYIRIFTSDGFLASLKATFKFAGIVGVGTFFLSMFFAYFSLENRKGSKVYQTMFALPIALSSVPISAMAIYILGKNGLLNELLGTEVAWLSTEATALFVPFPKEISSGFRKDQNSSSRCSACCRFTIRESAL